MNDMDRRDALRLTAAGLAVAGTAALVGREAQAQEEKKFATAEARWKGHKTANADEVEKQTKPVPVSIGVKPPGDRPPEREAQFRNDFEKAFAPMGVEPTADFWAAPRPDLNGLRVKLPNRPEIYLIDRGYRRWIPNPATYNNLFRDWNGVVVDINIDEIPLGASITSGAILARADGFAPVYLIDQGMKRWITSPAIMDQYYFAWNRVYVLPPATINSIPSGPNIDS